MIHDSNDEAEKRDDMLDDKELVAEIANRCECAYVHPDENHVGGKTGRNAGIGGPLQCKDIRKLAPCISLEAKVKSCEEQQHP